MEAVSESILIRLEAFVIVCPKCSISFVVYYHDKEQNFLLPQVPDYGGKFFCPYCGMNVNENEPTIEPDAEKSAG